MASSENMILYFCYILKGLIGSIEFLCHSNLTSRLRLPAVPAEEYFMQGRFQGRAIVNIDLNILTFCIGNNSFQRVIGCSVGKPYMDTV